MDTGSLGWTDCDRESRELPFVRESSRNEWSSVWVSEKPSENLWVRISKQTSMSEVVVSA